MILPPGPERFADTLAILPHPDAPLFKGGDIENAKALLRDAMGELASPNPALSKDLIDLIRQATLVNLFFAAKYVIGPFNGTDYLNFGLQLDMANFRMSPACMGDGARAASAIFRGSAKTDLLTVDASVWELLRDPGMAILIANAKEARAATFTDAIRNAFMTNPLLEILFPAWCAYKKSSLWNASAFVLPNRPVYRKEPSVKALGCTGSTEGDRADLFNSDDLIGLDDLTAENLAGTTMNSKTRWFKASEKANLRSQRSRYLMEFTTFGAESLYSEVFNNLKGIEGDPSLKGEYEIGGSKKWTLYIRDVIENGVPTLPEVQTLESLRDLEKSDPMLYFSQYRMLPKEGGLVEFKDLPLGRARLLRRGDGSDFVIRVTGVEKARVGDIIFSSTGTRPEWDDGEDEDLDVGEMGVVSCLDPAGTGERDAGPKTSRSALHAWARDYHTRSFLIYEDAGFYEILTLFRKIKEMVTFFKGLIPWVGIEKAAMQRIIRPMIEKDRNLFWEDSFVGFRDVDAGGEKDARIRYTLGPLAARGLLWVCEGTGGVFEGEFGLFPLARRKDALDAAEKCLRLLPTPESPDEVEEGTRRAELVAVGRDPITGY